VRALIALCCCIALGVQAETFSAKVIVVMDGDTIMVLREGGSEAAGSPPASNLRRRAARKIKIRLANIDAPEVGHAGMGGKPPNSQKDQDFGKQSRDSLQEMVGRKIVQIDSRAVDQYGRIVGVVSVDGLNVNQEQVIRGMAWAAPGGRKKRRASPGSPETQELGGAPLAGAVPHFNPNPNYSGLQSDARQARRGLWGQASPQAPWRWRKLHPSAKPVAPDLQRNSQPALDKQRMRG
jgi:endonuclease YncB( thermonuclease family)